MTRSQRLGHRDLDAMLGFSGQASAADGTEPFELAIIERLALLIPADQAGYYEYRVRRDHSRCGPYRAMSVFQVQRPGGGLPETPWNDEILAAWWYWPLNDFCNRSRVYAIRFSDNFATSTEKRRNAWHALVMRPSGIGHEIDLWLPAPPDTVRAFFLVRGEGSRDFSERDCTILSLLRPHLSAIRERWQRRHQPEGLTPREAELLELLRVGLTNRQIAERLVISPDTVRTHLANLFEKLGVHTRTAAANHDLVGGR